MWLAEDRQFNRLVALKRMRTDWPGLEERFGSEAQITGQLEHPAVVPVHDWGADADGRPFYVMKFVRGTTLKHALQRFYSLAGPNSEEAGMEYCARWLQTFIPEVPIEFLPASDPFWTPR